MQVHELLAFGDYPYRDRSMPKTPIEGLITSSAMVGMEFEYEGTGYTWEEILSVDRYRPLKGSYVTHQDGSLRGRDAVEFVFKKPLPAPGALVALKSLIALANENKFSVSRRTGFHVHLNVGNLEITELWNLLRLYALFEPAIYTAVSDHRSGSIFCIPWFRDLKLADTVAGLMRAPHMLHTVRTFGKYSGLNLQAISEKGSVEFRHLRNTKDEAVLVDWLNLILALHKKATSPDFAGWFENVLASENYRSALRDLYAKENVDPWKKLFYPQLEEEINQLTLDLAIELNELAKKSPKPEQAPAPAPAPQARDLDAIEIDQRRFEAEVLRRWRQERRAAVPPIDGDFFHVDLDAENAIVRFER